VHASGVASAAQGRAPEVVAAAASSHTMWMTGFTAGLAGRGGHGADAWMRAWGRLWADGTWTASGGGDGGAALVPTHGFELRFCSTG
jgi:hypothetical protein